VDAEQEIRELIDRWLAAIRAYDLDGVLADHSPNIVMFDVPPPERGHRGLAAYRGSWPEFFGWLRSGAEFELDELTVTAGDDVAFAFGLLRCGTPAEREQEPDRRLRLTVGLAREDGRWTIAHEHHSFTIPMG
jgi:uncharacterized protein (TIGR02246 family)